MITNYHYRFCLSVRIFIDPLLMPDFLYEKSRPTTVLLPLSLNTLDGPLKLALAIVCVSSSKMDKIRQYFYSICSCLVFSGA